MRHMIRFLAILTVLVVSPFFNGLNAKQPGSLEDILAKVTVLPEVKSKFARALQEDGSLAKKFRDEKFIGDIRRKIVSVDDVSENYYLNKLFRSAHTRRYLIEEIHGDNYRKEGKYLILDTRIRIDYPSMYSELDPNVVFKVDESLPTGDFTAFLRDIGVLIEDPKHLSGPRILSYDSDVFLGVIYKDANAWNDAYGTLKRVAQTHGGRIFNLYWEIGDYHLYLVRMHRNPESFVYTLRNSRDDGIRLDHEKGEMVFLASGKWPLFEIRLDFKDQGWMSLTCADMRLDDPCFFKFSKSLQFGRSPFADIVEFEKEKIKNPKNAFEFIKKVLDECDNVEIGGYQPPGDPNVKSIEKIIEDENAFKKYFGGMEISSKVWADKDLVEDLEGKTGWNLSSPQILYFK